MAKKETRNSPKDLIEATPEETEKLEKQIEKLEESDKIVETPKEKEAAREREKIREKVDYWKPKTELGRMVKEGKVKNIDVVLTEHRKILEPEIVDKLLTLETDLLLIGQAKGKFGGGKRRAWRQTQKKTMEGNVLTFSSMVVVGDRNGHVGLGLGKSKETLPAREKAIINGKCGSVRVRLIPAPRGTGLVIGAECKKILRLAGIKDVYSYTEGQTRTTFNFARACIDALKKTNQKLITT